MSTNFHVAMGCVMFAVGYTAAVFSWDTVKGFFLSVEARAKALEAKLADLKAKL